MPVLAIIAQVNFDKPLSRSFERNSGLCDGFLLAVENVSIETSERTIVKIAKLK